MDLLFVGIGGGAGAICRFQLAKIISEKFNRDFPLGTFLINISGALCLGLAMSMDPGGRLYLLLGDGFLGAYTTFSTFMYEGFQLFQGKDQLNAFVYILGTLLFGILGYTLGYIFGKWLIAAV